MTIQRSLHPAIAMMSPPPAPRTGQADAQGSALGAAYLGLGTLGTVLGAYHGYARNQSVGWAIGWALLGGAFPFVTIPVALAQGFAKRGPR